MPIPVGVSEEEVEIFLDISTLLQLLAYTVTVDSIAMSAELVIVYFILFILTQASIHRHAQACGNHDFTDQNSKVRGNRCRSLSC